ncbi:AraC family transcriptional regulator [Tsuneonella mangrovi]|uniref:AraC family transcriptional regulator n=1 Tax=Tsuneonella mangrovi TaxID=1982042 RepID=UPI001F0A8082|nr:helix-turn-helix transcriptional regulator [Tsuneonella mangrovi]
MINGNGPIKSFDETTCETRPVVGLEDEYPAGFVDPPHMHSHAQLLYASSGVMSVVVDAESFVIPPQRALWIPAGALHEVSCRGPVSIRTLYFEDALGDLAGSECRVIEISDFLKALILELIRCKDNHDVGGRQERIVELLIDEVRAMPVAPFSAKMPTDYRLLRVCRRILENPADDSDLDDYASLAGMSRRTFTRLFRQETGMGLAVWRQQVRLMEAVSLLAMGQPVTTVAFDVGYESPSAFSAMFHRSFGSSPSHYRPGGSQNPPS